MTVRLHPMTPHGDQLHRLAEVSLAALSLMRVRQWDPQRIDRTVCGVWFAWGSWKGTKAPLPRCTGCFTVAAL